LNQILCLIAFPLKETVSIYTGSVYHSNLLFEDLKVMMFPKLYMNAPLLNNFAHIVLAGVYGAASALLTFSISLYIRRNYIFNISVITVFMVLLSSLLHALQADDAIPVNVINAFVLGNLFYFSIFILIVCAISAALIYRKIKMDKDIL
jgi:hypothetical protein